MFILVPVTAVDDGPALENSMDRRQFTNFLLAGGVLGWMGSVLYPLISFLKPPKVAEANVNSVKAGLVADFPNNSSEIVKFGRKPVIRSGARATTVSTTRTAATCRGRRRDRWKNLLSISSRTKSWCHESHERIENKQ